MVQIFGRGEADASDSRRGKRQGFLPYLGGCIQPGIYHKGLAAASSIRRSFGNCRCRNPMVPYAPTQSSLAHIAFLTYICSRHPLLLLIRSRLAPDKLENCQEHSLACLRSCSHAAKPSLASCGVLKRPLKIGLSARRLTQG